MEEIFLKKETLSQENSLIDFFIITTEAGNSNDLMKSCMEDIPPLRKDYPYLILEDESWIKKGQLAIIGIYVPLNKANQGIGTLMLKKAKNFFNENGIFNEMVLYADITWDIERNMKEEELFNFYEKEGFKLSTNNTHTHILKKVA